MAVNEATYPIAPDHTPIQVFHGSNARFKEFSTKAKRVENDFFGGGIAYFTDDQKVALTYSRAMTYRYGGEEHIYKVELTLNKIFDVNTIYRGDSLQKFFAHIKPEDFARGAGLLSGGADRIDVISKLKLGHITMTGQEVFKGLSRGGVNSSGAEKILMKLGYDGLRYNGGDNMSAGKRYVYLPYYSKDIKIINIFKVNRKIIAEALEMPPIGYLTFSRDLLPQIKDQDKFMAHLKALGISSRQSSFDTGVVRASQSDGFDMKKVAAIMKDKIQPILVSNDGFILDGHHRWIAAFNKNEEVPSVVMDAPILELIRVAADFYNSKNADYIMSEAFAPTETISEVFGGLRTHEVLYHHFDKEKGIDILSKDNLGKSWRHNIPIVHKKLNDKDYQWQDDDRVSNKISGTSLTRNINLSYNDYVKKWILEFDRKKLKDTNKIHVIDADLVAARESPHQKNFGSTGLARNRAIDFYRNNGGSANEFAEEFLEGELPYMHRYLRCIWLKDTKNDFDTSDRKMYDVLAQYHVNYGTPIKFYPSGKDATADLLDWVADEADFEADSASVGLRNSIERERMSHVIMSIRKSININMNKL